jgi:hypothetical protein
MCAASALVRCDVLRSACGVDCLGLCTCDGSAAPVLARLQHMCGNSSGANAWRCRCHLQAASRHATQLYIGVCVAARMCHMRMAC